MGCCKGIGGGVVGGLMGTQFGIPLCEIYIWCPLDFSVAHLGPYSFLCVITYHKVHSVYGVLHRAVDKRRTSLTAC